MYTPLREFSFDVTFYMRKYVGETRIRIFLFSINLEFILSVLIQRHRKITGSAQLVEKQKSFFHSLVTFEVLYFPLSVFFLTIDRFSITRG